MKIPNVHKLFFWITLAAYSTFFAEVFAGSDMFPFFNSWGILVVWPLYGLHTLLLITVIYRYGQKPTFPALIFAGVLFGLYEAYLTKMLWQPSWDAWIIWADVAWFEVFVLFWWHTWFSFVTPLVIGEGLLTTSKDIRLSLPPGLKRFYSAWWGWLALACFGAIFQSVNSPDIESSLLSGFGNIGLLAILTVLWRWMTRGKNYRLPDLLPGDRAFKVMVVWLVGLYVFLTITFFPENIPAILPGQVIVWGMYGLAIVGLVRALRHARVSEQTYDDTPFPAAKKILGVGTFFIIALPFFKGLLAQAAPLIIVITWLGGIAFALWALIRARSLLVAK